MPEKRSSELAAEDILIYSRKSRPSLEEEFIHDLKIAHEFENAKRRRFKLEPNLVTIMRTEKPLLE
jgi:hypothetical protein